MHVLCAVPRWAKLSQALDGLIQISVYEQTDALPADASYSEQPPKAQRTSPLGIQMLSPSLHHQIFNCAPAWDDDKVNRSREYLQSHGLLKKEHGAVMADVDFQLPPLVAGDLDKHFRSIALTRLSLVLT